MTLMEMIAVVDRVIDAHGGRLLSGVAVTIVNGSVVERVTMERA